MLKERFLKNSEFAALYEKAYAELYQQLIDSGFAQETIDSVVARAVAAGDAEAETLGETIRQKLEQTSSTSTAEDASESSTGLGNRSARNGRGTGAVASVAEAPGSTALENVESETSTV